MSVRAQGHSVIYNYRFKQPVDIWGLDVFVRQRQKDWLKMMCPAEFLRIVKATETHTYYSSDGERLTGFSMDPADCQQ
jgi:hypothetical protein